jgi:hypothetical protein
MRPKVVILTLLVMIGVVAAMAILKGTRQQPGVASPPPEDAGVQEETHSNPTALNSTNIAVQAPVPDAETLTRKIIDIQAEGAPTPQGRAVLLAALKEGQDKEVRQAALNAIVQLDDTAAIPGLEQALPEIADPRDKVAVLDAIEQLKLPSTTPEVAPSGNLRSYRPPGSKPAKLNPRFQPKSPRGRNPSSGTVPPPSQPAAAPDAQQPQPQPAAPQ